MALQRLEERLLRGEDGAHVRVGEPALRGRREVVVGRAVRAAVDDPRADLATPVTERERRPARERLVRDTDRRGAEPAAARERVAVEAGPVPGRPRAAEDVER